MRYSMVLALALGNLVTALDTPTPVAYETPAMTPTTPSGTPTATPGTGTGSAEDWVYYGCLSSLNGFKGFSRVDSSSDNSLETCSKKCKGSRYLALHDSDCFCSDEDIDKESTSKVGDDECDISCPGAPSESCGGNTVKTRMSRRQNVPLNFLLTVYVSIASDETTATVTETVPGRLVTETATVTEANGAVTTVVNTIIAVPTEIVIICYGDYCAPENHCPVCTNWQVVCRDGSCCPEQCRGDDCDRLVLCEGDRCHYSEGDCDQKITCHGDQCNMEKSHGDGQRKLSCNGDECKHETCTGDECGKKYICEGDECEEEVQCKGEGCPAPTPNKPTPGNIVYVPQGGKTEGGKPMIPSGSQPESGKPGSPSGNQPQGGKPMIPSEGVRPSKPFVPTGESCTGEGCPSTKPMVPASESCTGEGCPGSKPMVPAGESCTGEGCPGSKPSVPAGESCTGEGCPGAKPYAPAGESCTGEGCPGSKPWVPAGEPCTGEGCPVQTPASTPVVVSGAGQKAIAGLAVIMAGAVFAL